MFLIMMSIIIRNMLILIYIYIYIYISSPSDRRRHF